MTTKHTHTHAYPHKHTHSQTEKGDTLYRMCAAQPTSLRIAEERMTISISKNKTAASQTSHLILCEQSKLRENLIFSQNAKKSKSKGKKQELIQANNNVKQMNTFPWAADVKPYNNTQCLNKKRVSRHWETNEWTKMQGERGNE